jgi:hypothetical protein
MIYVRDCNGSFLKVYFKLFINLFIYSLFNDAFSVT